MRNWKVFLLVVLAVQSTLLLQASPLRWQQLSTKNGLLQNTVYAVTSDPRGFVWLGTAEGLCRYDGHSFKSFSDSPLTNHSIFELNFLNDSILQVAGEKGLELFNTRSFTATLVRSMPLKWGGVQILTTGPASAFCIVENEGVYQLTSQRRGGYQIAMAAPRKALTSCSSLLYNGRLLIFSRGTNVYLEVGDTGFTPRPLPLPVEGNPIMTPPGIVTYITTRGGQTCLCRFNLSNNTLVSVSPVTLSPNNKFSRQMSFDPATRKLYLLDRRYGLIVVDSSLRVEATIPGQQIGLRATQNNVWLTNTIIGHTLWLSADVEGVFFSNFSGEQFGLYREPSTAKTIIKGIYTDERDNVYGGVFLDSFRKFGPYGIPATASRYKGIHYPKLDAFNSIEPAGDRVLIYSRYFFGYVTASDGSMQDLTQQLLEQLPPNKNRNCYFEARSSSASTGLLSHEDQLYFFDVDNNRLNLNKLHDFPASITAIGIGDKSHYYIGTEKGLWLYDGRSSLQSVPLFSNYYIKHINVSPGLICVSSSSGLFLTDETGRLIKSFSMNNHTLLNNTVYGTWLNNKEIWGSCNAGLFHIILDRDTVFQYTAEDGVQDNEFNSKAFCFSGGKVLFGGVNGINELLPKRTWFNLSQLNAYLSGIIVNNSPWLQFNEQLSEVYLHHTQNTIELKFAAIAPSIGKFLKYQYRLKGLESDFHPCDGDLTARYIALPPGNHIFEIRINGFEQSITRQLLTIHIAPPFWQTMWFRSLIVILAAAAIYLTVKFYFNRKEVKMKAEIESLRKLQKERERISRDLHDNAGSLVTYMLMQLDDENLMETRTQELKHTARTLMNTLRETIWTLAEHPISNYEFCDKLITYAKKYVPLEVKFSKQLGKETLLPKDAVLNMYRICQEIFNNILKHSKANKVEVTISSGNSHKLKIQIIDNGIGFDTEGKLEESGNGLRNMLGRSKDAGLEMEIASEPGRGTSITIILQNSD